MGPVGSVKGWGRGRSGCFAGSMKSFSWAGPTKGFFRLGEVLGVTGWDLAGVEPHRLSEHVLWKESPLGSGEGRGGVGASAFHASLSPSRSFQATQKIQSTMPSAPDSKPIRPQPGTVLSPQRARSGAWCWGKPSPQFKEQGAVGWEERRLAGLEGTGGCGLGGRGTGGGGGGGWLQFGSEGYHQHWGDQGEYGLGMEAVGVGG